MGLSSGSSGSEGIQLCIFDLRRGQQEGQELEKILFFFPADSSFSTQLSVTGLSEGMITFTRIFSPDAACETIEAENHTHIFHQAETDIWMVMVLEKNRQQKAVWQIEALRKLLVEVHSLFYMFHGSIRAFLEKEPGGGLTCLHLYAFVMDYLSDFFAGKALHLPSLNRSFNERGMLQMLTVSREAAFEVQSLISLLESCAGKTPCYSLILFQDLLVSTTLSLVDALNIFNYAVLRLSPHAQSSGVSSWPNFIKGKTSNCAGPSQGNITIPDQFSGLCGTSPDGSPCYHIPRPLQKGRWSKGKDGFLVTDIWAAVDGSEVNKFPTVRLQHTEERGYLCVYQHKDLTAVLVVPLTSFPGGQKDVDVLKQRIIENASVKIVKVEDKLSKGWGGENAYHVGGYRYLLVDRHLCISRASPAGKVATLSKESLTSFMELRNEVDVEKRRTSSDKSMEICIRSKNSAWIIAHLIRGKELYMIVERGKESIVYASDAIQKFSDRYCGGAFSLE